MMFVLTVQTQRLVSKVNLIILIILSGQIKTEKVMNEFIFTFLELRILVSSSIKMENNSVPD